MNFLDDNPLLLELLLYLLALLSGLRHILLLLALLFLVTQLREQLVIFFLLLLFLWLVLNLAELRFDKLVCNLVRGLLLLRVGV